MQTGEHRQNSPDNKSSSSNQGLWNCEAEMLPTEPVSSSWKYIETSNVVQVPSVFPVLLHIIGRPQSFAEKNAPFKRTSCAKRMIDYNITLHRTLVLLKIKYMGTL